MMIVAMMPNVSAAIPVDNTLIINDGSVGNENELHKFYFLEIGHLVIMALVIMGMNIIFLKDKLMIPHIFQLLLKEQELNYMHL